jgi:hypothetical protein
VHSGIMKLEDVLAAHTAFSDWLREHDRKDL